MWVRIGRKWRWRKRSQRWKAFPIPAQRKSPGPPRFVGLAVDSDPLGTHLILFNRGWIAVGRDVLADRDDLFRRSFPPGAFGARLRTRVRAGRGGDRHDHRLVRDGGLCDIPPDPQSSNSCDARCAAGYRSAAHGWPSITATFVRSHRLSALEGPWPDHKPGLHPDEGGRSLRQSDDRAQTSFGRPTSRI